MAQRGPKHPRLQRRLVSARAAQMGRPVRGDDDKGDVPVMGLKDCRVEIGDRRPRGRDHEGGATADLRQPESEEPGRPFVDPHVEPQRPAELRGEGGIRKGSRARPGT